MRKVKAPPGSEADTRRLYYWLLLAIFVEYARPASYASFLAIPFLYSAIPLLLLVVSASRPGLRPMSEIFGDRLSKYVLIFFGLITLSVTHAEVTEYVFKYFKLVLGYVILFILIARITTTAERLRGLFVTLLVAHLFLLAMNPQVVTDPNTRHYILGATFLGDGNDFSLSLCILFPCAIEVALSAKKLWTKLLMWAGVCVIVLAIIASQSRGATLGIAAVLFYLWLRSSRKAMSLVGVAVIGIIVLIYAPPAYFQRMSTISDYQNEGSAQGRIEAWKGAIWMATDNPILGVGAGQFPTAFGTKYRTPGAAHMPWLTAHSSYFLVLGELGFPGFFVLLTLVIGNMRANLKLRREILARAGPTPGPEALDGARLLYLTTAAMIGFAVAGAFLSAAYYPHVFVLTGMLVAARSITAKQAGIPTGVLGRAGRALRRRPNGAQEQPVTAAPESSLPSSPRQSRQSGAAQR